MQKDANRSHEHTSQRLIKNAEGPLLYIAYRVQAALAPEQDEKRLNPKGKPFSRAIFAKKNKSMQRICDQSGLIPQIYKSD